MPSPDNSGVYGNSLLLFHRDLRLHDNCALNTALQQSRCVIPCVILDKVLLDSIGHDLPRVQYWLNALQALDTALRERGSQLHVMYGKPVDALDRLLQAFNADAVFWHRDASPYAMRRDQQLSAHCEKNRIRWHAVDDITLHPPEKTLKTDGTPYTVFTPFFRRACLLPVPKPYTASLETLLENITRQTSLGTALDMAGLRTTPALPTALHAKTALAHVSNLQNYQNTRDIPAMHGTSRLSAILRFGIVSSRDAWWTIAQTLGSEHPLLRQLYWRDFFFSIGQYFPRVFTGCFHQQYNNIVWPNKTALVTAWETARTGFPIVDAGLQELHETGYMHNRVRMIVASFLVKDLHCDWRIGERHFSLKLIDYDPCINNGNWQWAASTGCDAQPYFRIFNPWTQQQKFDPDCLYIKRWLPALEKFPAKTLHNLHKLDEALPGYVMPVVDHAANSAIAKQLFEAVRLGT